MMKRKTPAAPDRAPVKSNVASFRALHDADVVIPQKIRDGLLSLKKAKGNEGWEYEADFIKRAGISTAQMGTHRDEFVAHIVVAKPVGKGNSRSPRNAWFATVAAATEARGEPVTAEG